MREAKRRSAQNSSSACEGWRGKEVSSNATLGTEQLKDKLVKVIYITHVKFVPL